MFNLSKLSKLQLISRYKNKPGSSICVKNIIALTFVLIPHLNDSLDVLLENLFGKLIDLVDWFEDFYIGRKNIILDSRRPAHFPQAIWNFLERVYP